MKKMAMVLVVLAAFAAFQGVAFAGTVSGTVKSVDATAKTLEVTTATGTSSVSYGDATTWPAGVTDPSTLVGKEVSVTTDDATSKATSVSAK